MKEHERLKLVRKALKFTQLTFSEALEIKQGSYSDVERGKAGVSASLIKHLTRKFRVSPLWLCEGMGPMFIDDAEWAVPSDSEKIIPNKKKGVTKASETSTKSMVDSYLALLEHQQKQLKSINSLSDFLK